MHLTAEALREDILDFACRHTGIDREKCQLDNDAVVCGNNRIALFEVATSRIALTIALVAVALVAVIWIQFRSRQVVRALAVLAGGATLAVLVTVAWPWNLAQYWPRDTRQRPGTDGIKVELVSATVQQPSLGQPSLLLHFRAKDLPPGFTFHPGGRVAATLVGPDSATFSNVGMIQSGYGRISVRDLLHLSGPPRRDPETERKQEEGMAEMRARRRARGEPEPLTVKPDGTNFSAVISISPAWAQRMLDQQPVSCAVQMRIMTPQPEVLLEAPWHDGVSRGPAGIRLRQLRLDNGKTGAPPKNRADLAGGILLVSRPAFLDEVEFSLVDRTNGAEALISTGGPTTLVPAAVMPVKYDLRYVTVFLPKIWRTDKWIPVPEWLDSSSLVLVGYKDAGGFNREVATDHLVVGK